MNTLSEVSNCDNAVSRFGKRKWLFASFALAFVAIGFEAAAKRATAQGVSLIARAAQAKADGVPLPIRESMAQQSHVAFGHGTVLGCFGMLFATLAGISLLVSVAKQERGWHLIAATVLVAYLLLWLQQV
jgi:hypothetical protein